MQHESLQNFWTFEKGRFDWKKYKVSCVPIPSPKKECK